MVGKHRQSYAIPANLDSTGKIQIDFNKDTDWSKPIFMILEPDDGVQAEAQAEAQLIARNTYDLNKALAQAEGKCPECHIIDNYHTDYCSENKETASV